jgi:dihydropteroate synthase
MTNLEKKQPKSKQIMGILNCTPDSFYDGGLYFDEERALAKGIALAQEGADIIDVGGESTRPGSSNVPIEEEIRRTKTTISSLRKQTPCTLSIDSSKSAVVSHALEAGATFINDITGFNDPNMRALAKEHQATVCIMHMQNTPQTMQHNPFYPRGVVEEVYEWLSLRANQLVQEGIQESKIYLDVGIGFGKTVEDNLLLLKNLETFSRLGFGLLIGLSRKSFMQKIIGKKPSDLLSTTLGLNTMSLLKGVEIIRVHDVREHKEVVTLLEKIG